MFVDGSNLFGAMKNMGIRVEDYEKFYHYVFDEAVKIWRGTLISGSAAPAQLHRVYWYVLGSMDDWDLTDPKAQLHLHERFEADREIKRTYMALAGQKLAGQPQDKIAKEAWAMCFDEFEKWYAQKQKLLDGMIKFYHAVRSSTDFIDIIECGHWKVDFLGRSLSEKGLDTTLAVDMVAMADNYDVAIVLSGDADSIPSIKYMKRQNKHIAAVEYLSGYPPAKRGTSFSSHLKLAADFVVRIYEMDIVSKGIAVKGAEPDTTEA
jgi:uncharacterized LabA/DUF88 family protein